MDLQIIAAVIFATIVFIGMKFPGLLAGIGDSLSAGIIALAAVCTTICLILLWLSSSRKQVFYTRHGHIPLLEIWVGQPNGKSFRKYVKLLKERIEEAQAKSGLDNEQQLTGEMKMLRRLADENVINKDLYEKAKASLFKKF